MQKFFIITPCLNASRYIDDTILSVISQLGDFSVHYHIQDGGSSDDTLSKLEQWSEMIVAGSCLLPCKNISFSYDSVSDTGIYDAINNGFNNEDVSESADTMMTWINAGDRLEQGTFQTIVKVRKAHPNVSWLTGGHALINDGDSVIASTSNTTAVSQIAIANGLYEGRLLGFLQQEGTFWTSELWNKIGGSINSKLKLAGDFDLWRQFAKYSPLHRVHTITGYFRLHESGLSSNLELYNKEIDSLLGSKGLAKRKKIALELYGLTDKRDGNGMIKAGYTGPIIGWNELTKSWEARDSIIIAQRPAKSS